MLNKDAKYVNIVIVINSIINAFSLQSTSHFVLADGTSFLMVFFCIERQKVQSVQSVQLFTICK